MMLQQRRNLLETNMARNDKLGSALNLMNAIIEAGGEFPDACFKAASKFDCDYELLADAYDAQEADQHYLGSNDSNFDAHYA